MTLKILQAQAMAGNAPTCIACLKERGIPIGIRNLCPFDSLPITAHGRTGECALGLLTAPGVTQSPGGVGTEITAILKEFGETVGMDFGWKGCDCKSYALILDRWGVDKCEQRIPEIVAKLRANWESVPRPAPFDDAAGELVVREAIRRVREKAEKC